MNEALLMDYNKSDDLELDVTKLSPMEGKIILDKGRYPEDAVYFQDRNGKIIAYLIYIPIFLDEEKVVIESFTNETYRKKGLQERLNAYLIRMLRRDGVKKIRSKIVTYNSMSFLNRLKTKDPDGNGVLKAEISSLDFYLSNEHTDLNDVYLTIDLDLNETVDTNEDLLQKIIEIQRKVTDYPAGPSIAEIRANNAV